MRWQNEFYDDFEAFAAAGNTYVCRRSVSKVGPKIYRSTIVDTDVNKLNGGVRCQKGRRCVTKVFFLVILKVGCGSLAKEIEPWAITTGACETEAVSVVIVPIVPVTVRVAAVTRHAPFRILVLVAKPHIQIMVAGFRVIRAWIGPRRSHCRCGSRGALGVVRIYQVSIFMKVTFDIGVVIVIGVVIDFSHGVSVNSADAIVIQYFRIPVSFLRIGSGGRQQTDADKN